MTRRLSILFVGLLWVATFGTLALMSLPAHGQTLGWPLAPCGAPPNLPKPTATKPPGLPPQLGGSCSLEVEANGVGFAALLLCPKSAGGPPDWRMWAVRRADISPEMVTSFVAIPLAADRAEAIRAHQARFVTQHVADMCDVWGPARDRFNAAYLAATTPAVQWKVAPFGTQTTRPVFAVAAGRRAATATAGIRAPVGAACDCTAPIVEGLTTYCPAATTGALVAVCVKP